MRNTIVTPNIDSLIQEILEYLNTLNREERESTLESVIKSFEKERKTSILQVERLCATAPTTVPDSVRKIFQYAFEYDEIKCRKAVENALANYFEFNPDKSRLVKLIGQLNETVKDDLAHRLVKAGLVMAGYTSYF
jgi:Golgi nucleoside diphosphatase